MKNNQFITKQIALPWLVFLCVLCVLCVQTQAQTWKTVADGVEHAQVRREFGGKPVNINLLRLDLTKVRLDVHHAMDMAIGTEKTSSIATRHGAFAAINAGFFRLDTSIFAGDAAGFLMIDGVVLSEAIYDRISLTILNGKKTKAYFDRTSKKDFALVYSGRRVELNGVNRERKPDEIVLYSSRFGKTTLTPSGGIEVTVIDERVTRIDRGGGNNPIPEKGYVISAIGNPTEEVAALAASQSLIRPRAMFRVLSGDRFLEEYDIGGADVIGGVPQLIKNGKIDITWEQEKASKSFVETRHPRTAVAKLKDGKFLMLTADGRTEQSAGLDLYDLAAYMLELGAVDAMNLDGGGSTTMFLGGKVVNQPSDKEGERKVGDAILVTLRKKLQKPARK